MLCSFSGFVLFPGKGPKSVSSANSPETDWQMFFFSSTGFSSKRITRVCFAIVYIDYLELVCSFHEAAFREYNTASQFSAKRTTGVWGLAPRKMIKHVLRS
jgi:hypothetical protein